MIRAIPFKEFLDKDIRADALIIDAARDAMTTSLIDIVPMVLQFWSPETRTWEFVTVSHLDESEAMEHE